MVQRRAARWVLSNFHPKDRVSNMLNKLGWRSLEHRRCDARLVFMYKITQGSVAVECSRLLHSIMRTPGHTHQHSYLPIPSYTSLYQLSFFPPEVLSQSCLNSCSFYLYIWYLFTYFLIFFIYLLISLLINLFSSVFFVTAHC